MKYTRPLSFELKVVPSVTNARIKEHKRYLALMDKYESRRYVPKVLGISLQLYVVL